MRLATSAGVVAAFLSLTWGCSPSAFGPGVTREPQRQYRSSSPACSGLDLSSPELTPPVFRALVKCLTSNSPERADSSASPLALARWVEATSDEDLTPLLQSVNEDLLSQPTQLYELHRWVQALAKSGDLHLLLDSAGKTLENRDLVRGVLGILQSALNDPQAVSALAEWSALLEPKRVHEAVEFLMSVMDSPAWRDLSDRAAAEWPMSNEKVWTTSLQSFFKESLSHAPGTSSLELLVEGLAQGKIGGLVRQSRDVDAVADWATVFQAVGGTPLWKLNASEDSDEGRWARVLARLFHAGGTPIPCFSGAREIPDARLFVYRELMRRSTIEEGARYLQQTNPILLSSFQPICQYPEGLAKNYEVLGAISDTNVLGPLMRFLRILQGDGFERWIVSFVAEMESLTPVLAEISDRDLWRSGLALLGVPTEGHLSWIQDTAKVIPPRSVRPWMRVAGQASEDHWISLLRGANHWRSGSPMRSLLASVRKSGQLIDASPVLNFSRTALEKSRERPELIRALLRISLAPEFHDVLTWVSVAAQDGQLTEMVLRVADLFENAASKGVHFIAEGKPTPFEPQWGWEGLGGIIPDRRPAKLDAPTVESRPWKKACEGLDFSRPVISGRTTRDVQAWEKFQTCYASDADVGSTAEVLDLFNSEVWDAQWKQLGRNPFPGSVAGELVSVFKAAVSNPARLNRWAEGVAQLTADRWRANPQDAGGTILETALALVSRVAQSGDSQLKAALNEVKWWVGHPNLFPAIREIKRAVQTEPEDGARAHAVRAFFTDPERKEQLRLWVSNFECEKDPDAQKRRVAEILEDAQEGVTNAIWIDGRMKRSWDAADLRERLAKLIQKMGDPNQSNPNYDVIRATLAIPKYFSLPPGKPQNLSQHYPPEYLLKFLQDRAADWKPIVYYPPDSDVPRVRLVNTLDQLELVFLNADFSILGSDNFGLKFIGMIAKAWGDEPRSLWPAEIQSEYVGKDRPPTLREAYDEIAKALRLAAKVLGRPKPVKCDQEDMPGKNELTWRIHAQYTQPMPTDPVMEPRTFALSLRPFRYKARIHNLAQVLGALEVSLPESDGEPRGHLRSEMTGGLKVIRDLAWNLWASTPHHGRSAEGGWDNNLSVVVSLVEMGLLRQVGRTLAFWPVDDSHLPRLTNALIRAAAKPLTHRLLRETLRTDQDPEQKLGQGLLDLIFSLSSSGPFLRQSAYRGLPLLEDLDWTEGLIAQLTSVVLDDKPSVTNAVRWVKPWVEQGLEGIPPEKWQAWADALQRTMDRVEAAHAAGNLRTASELVKEGFSRYRGLRNLIAFTDPFFESEASRAELDRAVGRTWAWASHWQRAEGRESSGDSSEILPWGRWLESDPSPLAEVQPWMREWFEAGLPLAWLKEARIREAQWGRLGRWVGAQGRNGNLINLIRMGAETWSEPMQPVDAGR